MDTARYIVAIFAIVAYPPVIFYWFIIHPFIGFWRRVGPVVTWAVSITAMLAMATILFVMRDRILAVDFGTNWMLICFAIPMMIAGVAIEARCRRLLRLATLVGVPELRDEATDGSLLTSGVYALVRHPRYAGASLGLLSVVFFTNYLATWILGVLYWPLMFFLTVLEETELVSRYGAEYREYRRRVPRFFPRIHHTESQR